MPKHADDPTGLRFWRTLLLIIKEAKLGGRFLCKLGIHKWDTRTEIRYGVVDDWNWCKRPFCKYHDPQHVNRDYTKVGP